MDYTLVLILNFTIAVPALIGCFKILNVDTAYLPIILLVIAGLINESIAQLLIRTKGSNMFMYNLFVILETNLLFLQFRNWDQALKRIFIPLLIMFNTGWLLINTLFIELAYEFNSYYKIIFSLIVVLLAINLLNKMLVGTKTKLIKNAPSIICFALIIFFTYTIVIEIFWLYGLMIDQELGLQVYNIFYVINCLVNLILAFAFLWIPNKPRFILQSSSPASS